MNTFEFNFFRSSIDSDKVLFFGETDGSLKEELLPFESNWTMAHLVHQAGIFNSVGEAKRNNWNKPIPFGFTDIKGIGKNKIRITIFNEKE